MIVKKTTGYVCKEECFDSFQKGLLDVYDPPTMPSLNYKHWIAILDLKTCLKCRNNHGKIYLVTEEPDEKPSLHPNCRCEIKTMEAVAAGFGTKDGENGADWWLKFLGKLPDYYISVDEARKYGWKTGKSPAKYVPGKMLSRGIYFNADKRLPDAPGRIWYEADINYYEGKRNKHRVLWSNDGLIFVTYDYYMTFYEIA